MTTEQRQIKELQDKVKSLEEIVRSFTNAAQIDPLVGKAFGERILPRSKALVTSYDQNVNEAGVATYTVPKIYDGLFLVNGKIIGYHNIV